MKIFEDDTRVALQYLLYGIIVGWIISIGYYLI